MKRIAPRFPLTLVLGLAAAGAAGCLQDQGSVFIRTALPLDATCQVDDTVNLGNGILDLGLDAASANSYTNAFAVVTNLPSTLQTATTSANSNFPNFGSADNNVITFTEAETFFTTDEDRADAAQLSDQSPGKNNPRKLGIGGTVFNVGSQLSTEAPVTITTITQQDAVALQAEQFIVDKKLNEDIKNVVRIFVNTRVRGVTTGAATVVSAAFAFPIDLCEGCLTDQTLIQAECALQGKNAVAVVGGCGGGQDLPNFECQ